LSNEADHAERAHDDCQEGEDDDEGVLVVDQRVHERLTEVQNNFNSFAFTVYTVKYSFLQFKQLKTTFTA